MDITKRVSIFECERFNRWNLSNLKFQSSNSKFEFQTFDATLFILLWKFVNCKEKETVSK